MVKKCLLLPLLAAAFIACSDDDDNNGGNNDGKETATFTYEFKTNQTVLDIADVTIRYMGADSVQHVDTLSDTVWTKELTADQWDVTAGFQVEWALKADFENTAESYEIANAYTCVANALKGEGVVDFKNHGDSETMSVGADKIVEFFAGNSIVYSHADRIDANGNVTEAEITWDEDENTPEQGEEETPETPGQE